MVQDTGKTVRTETFKPVNTPEPVRVEESASGEPVVVRTTRRQVVKAIEDKWRIDDEWWRSEPVSRLYYAVMLSSGLRLVLYRDLTDGCWYKQEY
jgi:hypothetical protein